MKVLNYLNLNQYPIQLSFKRDRTNEFDEIYHSHQGIEILYVHSGHGRVITGGKIIELKPGAIFFFRPFHMHRLQVDFREQPYIRTLFVFEPSALQKCLEPFSYLHTFFNELFMASASQIAHTEIPEGKFDSFVEGYVPSANMSSPEKLDYDSFFLVSFINLLSQYIPKEAISRNVKSSSKTTDSTRLALHWLEEHFSEEFELDRIAEEVHLSPNHLSYMFHKETGSCISDYLAVRRIQEACMLLRTTSFSVDEIGNKVGINNFSYFCKFFKAYVGMTPSKFRRNVNQN